MSDRVAAGLMLVIATAFVVQATTFRAGFFTDPVGARLVPALIGVFVMGSCLVLAIRPRGRTVWPDPPTWARLAATLATFIVYGYLLEPVGFIVATTLAFTAFALLFRGPPWRSLAAAVLFSLASYALFSWALDLYLPTGELFEGWF